MNVLVAITAYGFFKKHIYFYNLIILLSYNITEWFYVDYVNTLNQIACRFQMNKIYFYPELHL